jgi:hypothetical protein
VRIGLVSWLIIVGSVAQSVASPTPEEIADALDLAYESGRYQTEMPREQPPMQLQPLEVPDVVKEIIRIVLYTILIVGGLLLLFYIVNALPSLREAIKRRRAGRGVASAKAFVTDTDRDRLDTALGEADLLARQGAYGEALHLMLLYCLNELRRRFGLGMPPALTSREILGLSALQEARHTALSVIVSAVELSHFGGRPVDEATYRSCRRRCEDVVLGGGSA